jgi:hypothetical protein
VKVGSGASPKAVEQIHGAQEALNACMWSLGVSFNSYYWFINLTAIHNASPIFDYAVGRLLCCTGWSWE